MGVIPQKDLEILRKLGSETAEAAADPINEERRENHRRIDRREKVKPAISIYQEPWHELNVDGELELHCTDSFCRSIEQGMRRTLYKWPYPRFPPSRIAFMIQGLRLQSRPTSFAPMCIAAWFHDTSTSRSRMRQTSQRSKSPL